MALSIKLKWGLGTFLAGTGVLMPEMLIDCLHSVFEVIEFSLDWLIEHLFHTDRHTTQVIVFYLLFAIVAYAAYRLIRCLWAWAFAVKKQMAETWRQNSPTVMLLSDKSKLYLLLSTGFIVLTLILFS